MSLKKLIESSVRYLIDKGAVIEKSALDFIPLWGHPAVLEILYTLGAVMVEDFRVPYLLTVYSSDPSSRDVRKALPMVYAMHFYGSHTAPHHSQYGSICRAKILENLFKEYTVIDKRTNEKNAELIESMSLLKLCRAKIRKQIRSNMSVRPQNINQLIDQLPNLPVIMYEYLCLKNIGVHKI